MYCKKLKEVLNHSFSIDNNIDLTIIKKLDLFLRSKLTLFEVDNINPVRFSNEMNVNYNKVIQLFYICSKIGLFEPLAYYRCQCGEKFRIYSKSKKVQCPNECIVVPNDDSERIYIYFKLNCEVENCDFINHNEVIADMFEDELLGKYEASYSDFENIIGEEEAKDLIETYRMEKFSNYLKGD